MRYPDGGGLSAEGRVRREAVRFEAAELFEQGVPAPEVARRLRVTRKSACAWRRDWAGGGKAALASKGPGGLGCRLTDAQAAGLATELERGPAAHGYADQRWTCGRVADLIARLFRVRYTDRGVGYLLRRLGFSPQVPVHRAAERDETAIETWRREVWPAVKAPPRPSGPGSARRRGSPDAEAAQGADLGPAGTHSTGCGVG